MLRVTYLSQQQGRCHLGEAVSEPQDEATGNEHYRGLTDALHTGSRLSLLSYPLQKADTQPPAIMNMQPYVIAALRPQWSAT